MSVDWTAIGVVSAFLVGGGGLAWKVISDRRAEERERRAKRPDVKVMIDEPTAKWSSSEDRTVRVRVVNQGDIPVRVVKISFKEGRPWERRVSSRGIADATVWEIEEGEAELPKEVPPNDGHLFTLPVPVKQRVAPRPGRRRRVRVEPLPRKPVRRSSLLRKPVSRGRPARSSEIRVQAVAKISTGDAFESPVYAFEPLYPHLRVVWDPSEGQGRVR